MTGAELRMMRKRLELERTEFALLLGYVGTNRNNETRVKRLEDDVQVPLYIGRLVWLIEKYFIEHNRNLPHWPANLHIEGEEESWM